MIRIGILGGAGYTAGELIRLLINHPDAELVFVNSSSNAGNLLTDVHEGLYGETSMPFTAALPILAGAVAFFCFAPAESPRPTTTMSTVCPSSTAKPSPPRATSPTPAALPHASSWVCYLPPSWVSSPAM